MESTASKNVWSLMNYTPPRGQCNHKPSLLTPTCSCMRFMLHPLKAQTSFDCDGCGHHASFHAMENAVEDAILKKWKDEQSKALPLSKAAPNKRKRMQLIQGPAKDINDLSS